jgi:hypothetical protein
MLQYPLVLLVMPVLLGLAPAPLEPSSPQTQRSLA